MTHTTLPLSKEFDVFEWAEENERLAQKSFERFKEEHRLDNGYEYDEEKKCVTK